MKIWLLENEERTGPFESFSVRERVANGELGPDTPAWYEGADGWQTLADVPTMVSAFPRVEVNDADQADDQRQAVDASISSLQHRHELDVPEQLIHPPKLHPVQRFFARMIDVMLYLMLVSYVKLMQGVDIYDPLTGTQQFLYHLPYVFIDGLMMHLFGTTIGKYLLGIKVTSATGTKLSLGTSILRSGRVWVIGLGMFTIIMPVSFLISWLLSRRFGKFLWDLPKNIQVNVKPLNPIRVIIAFAVIWTASFLLYQAIPEDMRPTGSFSDQWNELKERQKLQD